MEQQSYCVRNIAQATAIDDHHLDISQSDLIPVYHDKLSMPRNVQQIVQGISLSASGQATVDPSLSNVLFDLALRLEELTDLPIDVQHVVAAIVMAARSKELAADTVVVAADPEFTSALLVHAKKVFAMFGDDLDSD